ncbi:MAG: prepilin-type N-terminal cleavage/methylation domain-containing protein, partial [Candidatus Berkelbacteria bacterium]|nr:prepilin-type N-terminal cleavage/methylation domain-containing protein [Candidatus Berkelbacteria bacterium]
IKLVVVRKRVANLKQSQRAFTLIELPVVRKRGFTLIELLIVIAIILIMVVLAVPSFNQYSANNDIASKAEEIQSMLEKAYSLSQSPPTGVSSIYFYITNSSKIVCISTSDTNENCTSGVIDSITLADNMNLNSPAGDSNILGDNIQCELKSPNISNCKNLRSGASLTSLTKEISSTKTATKYQIKMDFSNYKVTVTRL